jgi:hypothetical protein
MRNSQMKLDLVIVYVRLPLGICSYTLVSIYLSSLVAPYKYGGTRRRLVLLMNSGSFDRTARTLVGLEVVVEPTRRLSK